MTPNENHDSNNGPHKPDYEEELNKYKKLILEKFRNGTSFYFGNREGHQEIIFREGKIGIYYDGYDGTGFRPFTNEESAIETLLIQLKYRDRKNDQNDLEFLKSYYKNI